MTTIRLNIKDNVLSKVLETLEQFRSDEVEVINEDAVFDQNKKRLNELLDRIEKGEEKKYSQEMAEKLIENSLTSDED